MQQFIKDLLRYKHLGNSTVHRYVGIVYITCDIWKVSSNVLDWFASRALSTKRLLKYVAPPGPGNGDKNALSE